MQANLKTETKAEAQHSTKGIASCILALPHWEMACQAERDEAKRQAPALTMA